MIIQYSSLGRLTSGDQIQALGSTPKKYEVQALRLDERKYLPGLMYIYIALVIPYLTWRITVINWDIWYGPLVYLAELYGGIMTMSFLAITQKIYIPIHRPVEFNKSNTVDIFITTYTEPAEILEPTIQGATRVRGVSNILLLDDGNRPEVKELADKYNIKYLARKTNEHAKAGNLNNGLKHSTAKFILTLDADHIPGPNFLERSLGYFDDPKVAFVQSPQTYYNHDSFLFRVTKKGLWSEQKMFYDVIQLAKNRWNSSFYVGTSAVLRREALDIIGGFATGTATEDIHTSLRLHARGWNSVFIPEVLAKGLEAASFKEFYKQRRRWAAGSLGLLMRSPDSPLRARGLSFAQRINYINATLAHLQGAQKLFYFIIPIICLMTLTGPVTINIGLYNLIFVGLMALAISITAVYARGTYHFIHTEGYLIANSLAHIAGLKGVLKVQKKFAVSRKIVKRSEHTNLKLVFWLLTLFSAMAFYQGLDFIIGIGEPANHSALVLWSFCFVVINSVSLIAFLAYLLMYERREMASDILPTPFSPENESYHQPATSAIAATAQSEP